MTALLTFDARQIRHGPHDWRILSGGGGPLVLFLHGAGASADSMAPLMERLAAQATVVAPDLPGHGGTRLGTMRRSGLPEMAGDVVDLVETKFGQPVALVGHSAGAAIALETNSAWPDVPRILVNPALAPFDGAAGWVFPRLARALASAPFASTALSQSFSKTSRIKGLLAQTGSPVTEEAIVRYQRLAASRDHIRGTLNMMAAWNVVPLRDRLPHYQAPALFLIGEKDGTVSPDVARLIAGRMPNARLRVFDGGHLLHEEAPDPIAEAIVDFAFK